MVVEEAVGADDGVAEEEEEAEVTSVVDAAAPGLHCE